MTKHQSTYYPNGARNAGGNKKMRLAKIAKRVAAKRLMPKMAILKGVK